MEEFTIRFVVEVFTGIVGRSPDACNSSRICRKLRISQDYFRLLAWVGSIVELYIHLRLRLLLLAEEHVRCDSGH